jgi:hypothetical protein
MYYTHGDIRLNLITSLSRSIALPFAAACLGSLLGCQFVGPRSIQHGRFDYNAVIQNTNQEQTFVNILRVHNHEATAFMDVSEVDAVVLAQASFTGGIGGIGAGVHNTSGEIGSVAGTLAYQESPTIRYTPLLGQALIAQLTMPLSPEAVSNIVNSGWAASTVLDLACDILTPVNSPSERDRALNAIQWLWKDSVIGIGAAKTQAPKAAANNTESGILSLQINQTNNPASDGGGAQADSLVLFVNRSRLNAKRADLGYWHKLQRIFEGKEDDQKDSIVLRTFPRQPKDPSLEYKTPRGPIIQTRSALGILKYATQNTEADNVKIVSPADYAAYRKNAQNPFFYTSGTENHHYLLIIESSTPPSLHPYVMHFDWAKHLYYYICDDDNVSKDNFNLLNIFLIVESVAPTPPLTPTISVGPGKAGS